MSEQQPITLADAHALETPQDSRELYARWAATYESDFVARNQYVIPDRVAAAFVDAGGRGTGGARRRLRKGSSPRRSNGCICRGNRLGIDGVDISAEMLAVSRTKTPARRSTPVPRCSSGSDCTGRRGDGSTQGCQRRHIQPMATRTLGSERVDPDRSAGATFAIGINAEHFSAEGFAAQLTDELADGSIRDLDPKIVDTYLPDSVHYGHKSVIAVFRRA